AHPASASPPSAIVHQPLRAFMPSPEQSAPRYNGRAPAGLERSPGYHGRGGGDAAAEMRMRIGRLRIGFVATALLLSCQIGVPGVPPAPGADATGFRLPALHADPDPVLGGRIADAFDRTVLLRGVNVNAHVEYWAYDPARFTTYPFTDANAEAIASFGWTAVRLLLSWSRVEPEPGVYDEAYLDDIEAAILVLQSHGI